MINEGHPVYLSGPAAERPEPNTLPPFSKYLATDTGIESYTDGAGNWYVDRTNGAANVTGLARNAILVDSATAYNATEILGFVCLVASGGASGGDATFTFVGDSTATAINVIDVGTPVGEEKPWHLTELDPGTSGVFLAFIPDA